MLGPHCRTHVYYEIAYRFQDLTLKSNLGRKDSTDMLLCANILISNTAQTRVVFVLKITSIINFLHGGRCKKQSKALNIMH